MKDTPFMKYIKNNPMILPTGGAARTYSALTTETFQKISMKVNYVSGKCLEELAPGIKVLTKAEGLQNHWNQIECRLKDYRKNKRNKT